MGSLARQFIDAVLGNAAMAEAFGVSGAQPVDGMVALTQLYAAIIATGFAVQAVGSLRGEETAGRLEMRLSGTLSRMRWLAAHGLVIVTGLVVIVVVSSIVLAAGMAWSMGTAVNLGRVLWAGAAYLPAELLVGGLALALFGLSAQGVPGGLGRPGGRHLHRLPRSGTQAAHVAARPLPDDPCRQPAAGHRSRRCRSSSSAPSPRSSGSPRRSASAVEGCRRAEPAGAPTGSWESSGGQIHWSPLAVSSDQVPIQGDHRLANVPQMRTQ